MPSHFDQMSPAYARQRAFEVKLRRLRAQMSKLFEDVQNVSAHHPGFGQDIERHADAVAEMAGRIAGYAGAKANGATDDTAGKAAMKKASKVRQALGYAG
jgi:hypothetical protein